MDVSAFGRPTSSAVADRVLNTASLNANPSPAQPAKVPADGLLKHYGRLYEAALKARELDQDMGRLTELDRIVEFADKAIAELVSETGMAGPPVPALASVPPAPKPVAPAMPQAGAPPQSPGPAAPPSSPGVVGLAS